MERKFIKKKHRRSLNEPPCVVEPQEIENEKKEEEAAADDTIIIISVSPGFGDQDVLKKTTPATEIPPPPTGAT